MGNEPVIATTSEPTRAEVDDIVGLFERTAGMTDAEKVAYLEAKENPTPASVPVVDGTVPAEGTPGAVTITMTGDTAPTTAGEPTSPVVVDPVAAMKAEMEALRAEIQAMKAPEVAPVVPVAPYSEAALEAAAAQYGVDVNVLRATAALGLQAQAAMAPDEPYLAMTTQLIAADATLTGKVTAEDVATLFKENGVTKEQWVAADDETRRAAIENGIDRALAKNVRAGKLTIPLPAQTRANTEAIPAVSPAGISTPQQGVASQAEDEISRQSLAYRTISQRQVRDWGMTPQQADEFTLKFLKEHPDL
jgi:hypothetical protein